MIKEPTFEWTGDVETKCELRIGVWYAYCARMGSFLAKFYPETHQCYDPNNPFSSLEYWFCCVNRCGEGIYSTDVGGSLVCGGKQCRAICEAIILAGHRIARNGESWYIEYGETSMNPLLASPPEIPD